MGLFGGVELQRAGDGLQDAVGGVAECTALQPDVVVDAAPARAATSSRRSPGTRRLRPATGSPTDWGLIRARREARNS